MQHLLLLAHTLTFFLWCSSTILLLLVHRPCGGGSGSPYVAKIQLGIPSPPPPHVPWTLYNSGSTSFFFLSGVGLMFEIRSTLFVSFFLLWIWPPPYLHFVSIGVVGRCVCIYICEGEGVRVCVCV